MTGTPSDPFAAFGEWMREAEAHPAIRYAHAATLATVDEGDLPDARVVLVHRFDPGGFVFSTDSRSPKAAQLSRRPAAALVFYWGPLDRQVRIRGNVAEGTEEESDHCFEERPRGSRLTAWGPPQSSELGKPLGAAWAVAEARFEDQPRVPRPEHWRAYRLRPTSIELWRAARHRLHDRRRYERSSDGWRRVHLVP
ncbi:MAG: pyridoxal 5'-phosphate synthase [Acidobacteriota bacterium]